LFCMNQYMEFRYGAILLSTPCDVCRTMNPEVEDCFHYTIGVENNNPYNIGASEINLSNVILNP